MKSLSILLTTIVLTSCIPLKIAPKFKHKGYNITNTKKFNSKLID